MWVSNKYTNKTIVSCKQTDLLYMSDDKVINKNAYKPFFEFSQNILNFHKNYGRRNHFCTVKNREKAIYVSYKQIPCSHDMYFEKKTFQTQNRR